MDQVTSVQGTFTVFIYNFGGCETITFNSYRCSWLRLQCRILWWYWQTWLGWLLTWTWTFSATWNWFLNKNLKNVGISLVLARDSTKRSLIFFFGTCVSTIFDIKVEIKILLKIFWSMIFISKIVLYVLFWRKIAFSTFRDFWVLLFDFCTQDIFQTLVLLWFFILQKVYVEEMWQKFPVKRFFLSKPH